MTETRKKVFLSVLRETGIFTWAARAASPESEAGAKSSFRDAAERDPTFKLAIEEAIDEANALLEHTAFQRAVKGVPEAVFQAGERMQGPDGKPAFVVRYSDRLLERLLASRLPATWSEKRQIEHSGTVGGRDGDRLYLTPSDLLALSPDDRTHLAHILEAIAINRNEYGHHRETLIAYEPGEVIAGESEIIGDYDETELKELVS